MATGPFEEDSFVNQNILLIIEACGTGTFAYVVFVKILPKQFSFLIIICIHIEYETQIKLKKIEYHQTNVCLNLILMSVGFIITVGLQLINQLGKFSKQRLQSPFIQIILYGLYRYMGYDIAYIHGHGS